MAQTGQTDQQMSSSSSNNTERDLDGDINKDKQIKSNLKLILFRRYNIDSRYKIYNNY